MSDNAVAEQPRVRDFDFSDRDFDRVRQLIYGHAGISLSPAKRDMAYSRLARRLRQCGLDSFGAYLDLVEAGDAEEQEPFTNALTTNLTAFFREAHHFPIFAEHLLRAGAATPLTVWCSAASTGEEPYSIAMTAVETFDSFTPPVRILASDIDTGVLEKAQAGVYDEECVEKLDAARVKRFFKRGSGSNSGKVRVRDELRNLVTFRRINLLEDGWPVRGPLDVIFCRNVMIYFDTVSQQLLINKLINHLLPGGYLIFGTSESLMGINHSLRSLGRSIYTREK